MKRSEVLEHIVADIEEALVNLENRPKTRPYVAKNLADNLLDMMEGFGMAPPEKMSSEGNLIFAWDPEE